MSAATSTSTSQRAHTHDRPGETLARAGSVITTLAASLALRFDLDELERELARHLLFSREREAIARRLDLDEAIVERLIARVYAKTGADNRQRLYDLALRLAAERHRVIRRPPVPLAPGGRRGPGSSGAALRGLPSWS